MLAIFAIFSLIAILPIYLTSKYNPKLYNYVAIFLILTLSTIFLVKKIKKIYYENNRNLFFTLIKLINSFIIIPLTIVIFGFEFIFFNLLKHIYLEIPSRTSSVLQNVIITIISFQNTAYIITFALNFLNPLILSFGIFFATQSFLFNFFYNRLETFFATVIIIIIDIMLIAFLLFINRKLNIFFRGKYKN